MDITAYIREMIKEDYGSFRRFAKIVGIPPSTLVTNLNKENGFGKMPVDMGMKICKELDLDINQIFDYDVKPLTAKDKKLLGKFEKLSPKAQNIVWEVISGLVDLETPEMTSIPYFDQAAGMGPGQYVTDATAGYIEVPTSDVPQGTDFAIRVVGDSMLPTFSSGDLLYIREVNTLDIGDIGVFSIDGEEYVKEMGRGELVSHNPSYPPMQLTASCYIQGKVLGKVKQ